MIRFVLAFFLVLPLVLAPAISARAHVGADGCVTATAESRHHAGHAVASGDSAHGGHHAPAQEQKRVAAIPCCLTVCPGLAEFTAQRSSPAISMKLSSRPADESAAGRAVEPADPPPRRHS